MGASKNSLQNKRSTGSNTGLSFTASSEGLLSAFKRLTFRQMNLAERAVLRKMGRLLINETKANMRKTPYKLKSLEKGIRIKVDSFPIKKTNYVRVDLLGHVQLRKYAGNSMLRQFEIGTVGFRKPVSKSASKEDIITGKARFTKKGYNRGKITAQWFFRDARKTVNEKAEIEIERAIEKEIKKRFYKD